MTLHRLSGAEWRPTRYIFGTMRPTGVVVHGTVSGLKKYSCLNYLLNSRANAKKSRRYAYHVLIETDGTIVQLADLKAKLRHAGRSSFGGRNWCNNFMIGVGLVNPGKLTGTTDKAKDIYGYVHKQEAGLVAAESPYHPNGKIWMVPTLEQRKSLARVIQEIKELLPEVTDVTTHFEVSPGRKSDPPPPSVIDVNNIDIGDLGNVGESLDAAIGCSGDGLVAHEVMHAADTKIAVTSTDKVLRKQSREYKTAGAIKGLAATPVVGAGLFEAASLSNVQGVKSYLDVIKSTVADHGVVFLIIGCTFAMIAASLIQHFKRQSYDDGRYEPSGEHEA